MIISRVFEALQPRLRSLRLRVIGLLILALLPAFALMVFSASESRNQAIQETQNNALRLTELAATNQRQLIDGARDILITLAQIPAIQSQDRAACLFFLSNILMQHPLYANFGAADAKGDVFCMTFPQKMPFSIADQNYFKNSMTYREFAISEYQISETNSQAIITLAYPVLNESGEPQGIVFANLDLRWLSPFMNAAPLPDDSKIRVIDRDGIILASYPEGEFEIGQEIHEISIANLVVDKNIGLTKGIDANNIARLYAYTTLNAGEDSDVFIIISIPTEAAFAESNRILTLNLTALVIGAMLALGIAWTGTQFFFLRQVNSLVNVTQRLSAGDLSARTSWSPGQGELGQLARAFDKMASTLQQRVQEQQWAQAKIQRQTARAEALVNIVECLNAKLELDSVLQAVCDETSRTLNVPAASVVVYRQSEEDLFQISSQDLDISISKNVIPPTINQLRDAATHLDELTMQVDIQAHPHLISSNIHQSLNVRYLICADLIHEGNTIGRLDLFTSEIESIGEDEFTLLKGIANGAALAITNAQLYTALRLQEKIRANLLHQVIVAQEEERMRISRELHDETSQSLTALLVGLDTINIAAQSDISRIDGHISDLKSVTEDMLGNLHRLIADLRPSLLDDLGLVAAIEWYGEQRLKPHEITFHLINSNVDKRLPTPIETAMFRFVQEGMTNIVRHANANSVLIRLVQEKELVTLEICDDGVGFDPQQLNNLEQNKRGLGLLGMRERAEILGGTFELESKIGEGTTICIRFHTYRDEEIINYDSYSNC